MKFKPIVLAALAALVSAQNTPVPSEVQASVLQVLFTALPSSALQLAATNQPAFQSDIRSSLSAGKTPDWYQALPTDVKTLLGEIYPADVATSVALPSSVIPSATPSATPSTTPAPSLLPTGGSTASTKLINSTIVSTVSSPTLNPTGGANTANPSGPESTGAAAHPTAVLGAGVAGALGVLGMLVL